MSKRKLERTHTWRQTRTGLLAFAAVELLLAYALALRSIDTGSLMEYSLTLILLAGVARNIVKCIRTFFGGQRKRQTAKA